jgi:hypothetical protein
MGEEWEINFFKKIFLSFKAAKNAFKRTWKMWKKEGGGSDSL